MNYTIFDILQFLLLKLYEAAFLYTNYLTLVKIK